MMDTAFLWKIRQTVEKNFKRKKIRIYMQFVTWSKDKQQKLLLGHWSIDKDVKDVQFNLFIFDVSRQK